MPPVVSLVVAHAASCATVAPAKGSASASGVAQEGIAEARAHAHACRDPTGGALFSMHSNDRPLLFGAIDGRLHTGRRFGILPDDLLRHMHVIGRTGVGKSVLLEHLAVGAAELGMGVGVIDPHGELAERVLALLPRARTNDVIFLDAAERARPLGWNPLEHATPAERPLVASQVLGAFKKVFPDAWGPRLEHVLRNTLLALLEVPDATLLGAVRLLIDESFRARVVARVRDPLVRVFWTQEFARYPTGFQAEVLAPVQNKLAAALTSPPLRAILGQRHSTVTAGEILRERRLFIASLSKGVLGEDGTAMLGAALVASFQSAAYRRASLPPEERHPFLLVVDEFASFTTEAFASMLSEARKFGLGLVLAHQHMAQLDGALASAVLGNVGSLVAFRVGAEDAATLAQEFAPELSAADLVRLARHQVVVRLAVRGLTTRPFTATTLPPREVGEPRRALLQRLTAERYGRDRDDVEREAMEDLGVAPPPPMPASRGPANLRLDLR